MTFPDPVPPQPPPPPPSPALAAFLTAAAPLAGYAISDALGPKSVAYITAIRAQDWPAASVLIADVKAEADAAIAAATAQPEPAANPDAGYDFGPDTGI